MDNLFFTTDKQSRKSLTLQSGSILVLFILFMLLLPIDGTCARCAYES